MNPLAERQVLHNRATSQGWALFSEHREKATHLLEGAAADNSRLCILGAGNCNDLDLKTLLRRYREIHLVDVDSDALTSAMARQKLEHCPAVHPHGGMDLTGMMEVMAGWSPNSVI